MFEHLNKEDRTIILSRAFLFSGFSVLAFCGLMEPFGLNIPYLVLSFLWILISTLVMTFEKNKYKQLSFIQHLIDTTCLVALVWYTGKSHSYFVYALPFLVFPAGLLISNFYAGVTSSFILLLCLYMKVSDDGFIFQQIIFWCMFLALSMMSTLFLDYRRRNSRNSFLLLEMRRQRLSSERKIADLESKLTHQSTTDNLTGLSNFKAFRSKLDYEVKRATRYKQNFSICAMRIDKLDTYEKEYGIEEKNKVIARISQLLKGRLRDTDSLCSYTSDGFMMMLVGSNPRQSIIPIRRIADDIQGLTFGAHITYVLSASFGISGFPDDAKDSGEMIALAASALERSTKRGTGKITLASALYKTLS